MGIPFSNLPSPEHEKGDIVLYAEGGRPNTSGGEGDIVEVIPVITYLYRVQWNDGHKDEYTADALINAHEYYAGYYEK